MIFWFNYLEKLVFMDSGRGIAARQMQIASFLWRVCQLAH